MAGEPHGDAVDNGAADDPFETFTGDRASAARLRANLARIAADHSDSGIASIANDVLAGRRPIRDLADDTEFSQVISDGVDLYRRQVESMTPTERAEMVRAARESLGRSGQVSQD